MPAPASLTRHLPLIEEALRSALAGNSDLHSVARYVLGWETVDGQPTNAGGKRIRPSLCLLAATALGADPRIALPGAVAVELVHNFSLVHDEVQDRDMERHGRPTVCALYGDAQAINAGDFLYTRAIAALATDAGNDALARMAALSVLNDAIVRMIAGQWQDISFETHTLVTPEAYLAMVSGKTGALLAAPAAMGALLAGASRTTANAFARWGDALGLAFQAHDDYLGIWGDPENTGKSNINDLVRRKKTLPVVFALGDPAAASIIREGYASDDPSAHVPAMVKALEACGAREWTRAEATRFASEAGTALEELPLEPRLYPEFAAAARYLVERDG